MTQKNTRNTLRDFWRYVERGLPNECWIWKGAKTNIGYGTIKINGKMIGAHRVSYQIHYGEINPGMCILHKCDNRSCVNPHHLYEGTYQDNADDRRDRGRDYYMKGENHGRAKLTWEKVRGIRSCTVTMAGFHFTIGSVRKKGSKYG